MFTYDLPHGVSEQLAVGDMSKVHREGLLPSITDTAIYTLVTSREKKLLLRFGDVKANPGPNTFRAIQ